MKKLEPDYAQMLARLVIILIGLGIMAFGLMIAVGVHPVAVVQITPLLIAIIFLVVIASYNIFAGYHNKKEEEAEKKEDKKAEEKKLYKTELIKERARLQAQKEFKIRVV